MEHLYAPWRYSYVSDEKIKDCVFCYITKNKEDENFSNINILIRLATALSFIRNSKETLLYCSKVVDLINKNPNHIDNDKNMKKILEIREYWLPIK